MLEESGRTVVDLISDYLRLLWEHIMSMIERARGETVIEALAIHVVITVPAIWKGYARQAMEDAAKAAGILNFRVAGATKLTLAPEPEAAALSTLLEQGSGVRPGNVYVICDAGGGTVVSVTWAHIISESRLISSQGSHKLQSGQHETHRPRRSCGRNRLGPPGHVPSERREWERLTFITRSGGLCGGIFIDQAFEHMCKGRLGPKWKRLSKTGIREIMKNEWEYGIKPQFKPAQAKKEYIVSLPAEAFRDQGISSLDDTRREPYIKNGRIHFLG